MSMVDLALNFENWHPPTCLCDNIGTKGCHLEGIVVGTDVLPKCCCFRAIATRKLMNHFWSGVKVSFKVTQRGCSKKVTMAIYVKKFTYFKYDLDFDLRGRFDL